MTDTLADTLSALEEKASPGDWQVTTCLDYWIKHSRTPTKADEGFMGVGHFGDVSWPNADKRQAEWEANAALIVTLRNNLPAILSALREREAMRAALKIADHDLITTHNLRATDLSGDQMNEALNRGVALSDIEWMTDNSRGLDAIHQALGGVDA